MSFAFRCLRLLLFVAYVFCIFARMSFALAVRCSRLLTLSEPVYTLASSLTDLWMFGGPFAFSTIGTRFVAWFVLIPISCLSYMAATPVYLGNTTPLELRTRQQQLHPFSDRGRSRRPALVAQSVDGFAQDICKTSVSRA